MKSYEPGFFDSIAWIFFFGMFFFGVWTAGKAVWRTSWPYLHGEVCKDVP